LLYYDVLFESFGYVVKVHVYFIAYPFFIDSEGYVFWAFLPIEHVALYFISDKFFKRRDSGAVTVSVDQEKRIFVFAWNETAYYYYQVIEKRLKISYLEF